MLSVAVHGVLHASSFIPPVPRNRVKHSPMIWTEFRIHSAIFALRHVVGTMLFLAMRELASLPWLLARAAAGARNPLDPGTWYGVRERGALEGVRMDCMGSYVPQGETQERRDKRCRYIHWWLRKYAAFDTSSTEVCIFVLRRMKLS